MFVVMPRGLQVLPVYSDKKIEQFTHEGKLPRLEP